MRRFDFVSESIREAFSQSEDLPAATDIVDGIADVLELSRRANVAARQKETLEAVLSDAVLEDDDPERQDLFIEIGRILAVVRRRTSWSSLQILAAIGCTAEMTPELPRKTSTSKLQTVLAILQTFEEVVNEVFDICRENATVAAALEYDERASIYWIRRQALPEALNAALSYPPVVFDQELMQ